MMELHELLRPELIRLGMEAEKKREAISELMDVLVQYHEVPMKQRDILLDALYENEDSLGSGMEQGIALAHLATDLVQDTICTIGTAPAGIPFRSLDGKPAKIIVLLLVPKKDFETEVRAIRRIQQLLADEAFVAKLLRASGPHEAHQIIEEAEVSASKQA